jgi:diphosphate--fructose-6-phosphate 1-phosphotransferase
MKKKYILLNEETLGPFRNQGGFDLLGTGRDKIKTKEQFESCLKHANELELTGLVVIGGDDSNTNACYLAEYFKANNCPCNVVGIPKTIDGDLKGNGVGISFGHHTASRTFSELVGNLLTDNQSTKKYYSFVRLMGRDASHITLEVALLSKPNVAFISEEVGAKKVSIVTLVNVLCDVIKKRTEKGVNYGLFLIPEGIVEFIPEMNVLIDEINTILALKDEKKNIWDLIEEVSKELSENSKNLLEFLPDEIKEQLFAERDSHGNVQVSKIETERLFLKLVRQQLENDKSFKGSFQGLTHFFGYV